MCIRDRSDPARERAALHDALARIVTTYYQEPDVFARVGRHAIALNGSFFNAQRMIEQYASGAYRIRSWEA